MFFPGCGADQNPLPRRDLHLCERYGSMLAAAVEEVLVQPMEPVAPILRTAFSFVELPYERNPTRAELEEATRAERVIRARWAQRMLRKLDAGEVFSRSYPYPVQVWRVGADMLFIGLGAEAVVDYALRFRQQYGPKTWVCGYTNDLVAYIPSLRVWREGGYEGGSYVYEYGRPADRWDSTVETRVVETVERLAREVTGR
jgi:hypothetical protein